MLDTNVIQSRGCSAVTLADGRPGLQFKVRNPNYRGIQASLLIGVDVWINGNKYPREVVLVTLQDKVYSHNELQTTVTGRWQLDEMATITVPLEKAATAGVYQVDVTINIRRPYIPVPYCDSPFSSSAKLVVLPNHAISGPQLGVSTYSFTNDIYTLMSLEDVMADIADMQATGIEMLSEGNIQNYPNPSKEWQNNWFALLDKYQLKPTNLGTWVDTKMWSHRDLTAEEGAQQIMQDLRIAKQLGFSSIRPKFGVISLDLIPHPIWKEAVTRSLDLAEQLGIVICPEIHSPTPIKHPVTQDYIKFIEDTKTDYFKLIIDTGIFQTTPIDLNFDHQKLQEGEMRPPFLEPLAAPVEDLREIIQHVHFIQSKFFEVDDQLNDLHVPWESIIKVLKEENWNGWLSSEYEGLRQPYLAKDQVRRQHALLRTLLAK